MNAFRFSLILAAAATPLLGCGGGASGGHAEEPSEAEAAYAGPIGSTDSTLGQERYAAVCGNCHGADGTAGENAPAIAGMHWTAAHMRQQIREGDDHMRPISPTRLSDEHMEAVLAYLVTIDAVAAE